MSPFYGYQDVAIVGGGIGGTYTGWRLRDRGWRISIYENTDRIGGRILSVFLPSVPNVAADLGAMRFISGTHTTLENLLPKLGLQSEIFPLDQFEKMYHLRGQRLSSNDMDSPKLPYNLAPGESRNIGELKRTIARRALDITDLGNIQDIEEAVTHDGIPLYKQGFQNIMAQTLSREAKEYIASVIPYASRYRQNNNAAVDMAPRKPSAASQDRHHTVVGGMDLVTKRLADQFLSASPSHNISLNRRVDSIRKVQREGKDVYELTVYETETTDGYTSDKEIEPYVIYAYQVILTLPPPALQKIHWAPFQYDPVKSALGAVTDYTAMKIFLAYPSAWWDKLNVDSKAFITDLPLRQGGEFGRFRNSSGRENALFMVSYADENNDYWRHLRSLGTSISPATNPGAYSVSTKVVEHVHHHLAILYDVNPSDIPWPLDGVMHFWEDPQNGGCWQLYKPGYKPTVVSRIVKRPSGSDRVFIATNAFSDSMAIWAEGALNAVDDILTEFFSAVC